MATGNLPFSWDQKDIKKNRQIKIKQESSWDMEMTCLGQKTIFKNRNTKPSVFMGPEGHLKKTPN